MTQLDIRPLPASNNVPAASACESVDAIGYVDDAAILQLLAPEQDRPAKSPTRLSRQQSDDLDYAGWFSPFHATREMAFARG